MAHCKVSDHGGCDDGGNILQYQKGIDPRFWSSRPGGKFACTWGGFKFPGLSGMMKFMFVSKNNSNIPSQKELDVTLPVKTPEKDKFLNPPADKIQATWLGHATVLVQMDGMNFLTDPIFSEFCGPFSCKPVPKRYRKVPCTIDELPRIDAVVISHNHYDHLDVNSVEQLHERFGDKLTWFVPMGCRDWMIASGCRHVKEMDWWQIESTADRPDVKFRFTPAQHWSARGALDRNKTLWGSWCVLGPKHKFYFAGDTGYCDVFKEIGKHHGPFDLAAIPIGACEPREFMKSQHINPEEAFKIHKDIKAKLSLGVHWGTFNLSHEFYLEPKQQIDDMEGNRNPKSFITVNPGSTITSDFCTDMASAKCGGPEPCENLGATSLDNPSESQSKHVNDKAISSIETRPQNAEILAI